MQQMRRKCFYYPIYGKQLCMIAIVVEVFFFIKGQFSSVSYQIRENAKYNLTPL